MASDDLNAPLGQNKKKRLPKLPANAPQIVAVLLGLFGLAVAAWGIFANDPLGGEPVAVVATAPLPAGRAHVDAGAALDKQYRHDGAATAADPNAAAVAKIKTEPPAPPPGSKTVTIIDGSSGKSRDVLIPGNGAGGTPKAPVDAKLLEPTRHGVIPKIGPDGTRALALYAEKREVPDNKKDWPRIAVIVGSLGISASGTADALAQLPAPVTLALAPYGAELEKLAEQARAQKHEVLLQVPMEPFDYPDNDPGPQTLLTSLSPEQNVDRLHWLMSRFQGYVGMVSYMGGKFTASEASLSPVLREAGKRGLDLCRRRRLGAQHRQPARRQPEPALRQDRHRDRRRADADRDRSRAGAAGAVGARARHRGRPRHRAAGDGRAHRRLGKDGGEPRLCAGADHHGGAEGEVVIAILHFCALCHHPHNG